MPDYEFRGTIDSDGNISGTISTSSDVDSGPLGSIYMAVIYVLCLIGGIIMISNVMSEAPACIVPAALGFIIMLIPLIMATKSGDFFKGLLIEFYKWSDLLIGLIIVMYWIAYLSQAVSIVFLSAATIGLMYLTGVSAFKVFQKVGVVGCVITTAVPIIVFLICCVTTDEFEFGYLALIPTISIFLSLLIREITNVYDFEYQCLNDKIAKPIIKMCLYVCIAVSIFLFGQYVGNDQAELLQTAKDYISENKFCEAREILQDIKSEEAKELYESIRYRDIQVGEIIYNGYYEYTDARSVSEGGVAFVCLDVVEDQALLISLDVIRLAEQFSAMLDEELYTSEYSFDLDKIISTTIGDEEGKFFLLSKEQYDNYVKNDSLDDYLKSTNVSGVAKQQKESVDNDTYKWTQPYIDIWLLNDFAKEEGSWVSTVGTIDTETGEYAKVSNMKVYAGIRLCYYVDTK